MSKKNENNIHNVIVLDGGGTRGLYTYKILQSMQISMNDKQLHSVFDLIIGVSVGALVGALLAMGWLDVDSPKKMTDDKLLNNLTDIFRQRNKLGPVLAPMFDGVGKTATLKRIFGEATLGEVLVPLVVVTCDFGTGAPRLFCSWQKKDKDFYLADILDASSSAPVVYPPTFVNEAGWLLDGGTVANKPLIQAYDLSTDFFHGAAFRILSIGTRTSQSFSINQTFATDLGLLTWISIGLIDMVMGVGDRTAEKHLEKLLGDKFLRIENHTDSKMEDTSPEAIKALIASAMQTWTNRGTDLLNFLQANQT